MPEAMNHCWSCDNDIPESEYYESHFQECDHCGESYCLESYEECPNGCYGSGCDCEECNPYGSGRGYYPVDGIAGEYNAIYNYGFKPRPTWFGGQDAPFHVGFELEITADMRDPGAVYRWTDSNPDTQSLLYVKEDSSVRGFEIVSHPMTPDYFHSVDWDSFFAAINEAYPTGRDESERHSENRGHGLHVHISKRPFTARRSLLARWSYLVNRNSEHVARVARRHNSNWALFTQYPVSALLPGNMWQVSPALRDRYFQITDNEGYEAAEAYTRMVERRVQWNRRGEYLGHGHAFNAFPPQTVEIRAGRSTRVPGEFIATVDFAIASAEYVLSVQPCHATVAATKWEAFLEWVAQHEWHRRHLAVFAPEEWIQPALFETAN